MPEATLASLLILIHFSQGLSRWSAYQDAMQIVMVSVGASDRQDHITYSSGKNWGLMDWAEQIVQFFIDSDRGAVDYKLNICVDCGFTNLIGRRVVTAARKGGVVLVLHIHSDFPVAAVARFVRGA